MQQKKAATDPKKFPLRITNKTTYPVLEKEAKSKPGVWSVNTLINSILEDYIKKLKKIR